jgi:hypothetical protein
MAQGAAISIGVLCRPIPKAPPSGLQPKLRECAGGSGKRIGSRKTDATHAFENFGGSSATADVPVLVLRVGADDQEVLGGRDAAMAGSSGQNKNIARMNRYRLAAFSTEDQVSMARSEAKHLVRGGVVVMKVIDAIAPLRRPSVHGEEALHFRSEILTDGHDAAIEEDGQRAVWHPAIRFEMKLLRRRHRRNLHPGCRSFSAS